MAHKKPVLLIDIGKVKKENSEELANQGSPGKEDCH